MPAGPLKSALATHISPLYLLLGLLKGLECEWVKRGHAIRFLGTMKYLPGNVGRCRALFLKRL
jgi:hypothetical protein